ncbi:Os04g0197275, partial [Oryza sativa Japonica Group]
MVSRLLLGMYSYTSSFSSCKQTPSNRTKFLCLSLAASTSSFFNSWNPCEEVFESLFTAISSPSSSIPWKNELL